MCYFFFQEFMGPPRNRLVFFKARLHRRFLSRQLAAKLHQVSNMFETPAISRQQIVLIIAPGLHVRFWSCNFSATKIASSCRNRNRLSKRAFTQFIQIFPRESPTFQHWSPSLPLPTSPQRKGPIVARRVSHTNYCSTIANYWDI